MRIVVADFERNGHREMYYKTVADAFKSIGEDVVLLSPDTGLEMKPLLPFKFKSQAEKRMLLLRNELILRQNLRKLRSKLSELRPDLVFFPCLDAVLPGLACKCTTDRLMPYKWAGIMIQTDKPVRGCLVPDYRRALRSKGCIGAGYLTENDAELVRKFRPGALLFPDFTDTTAPDRDFALCRELQERRNGRKVVALLGAIDSRKGVGLLTRIIKEDAEGRYFYLIAGGKAKMTAEEEAALLELSSRENCLISLERIPDEASFNALIDASDIVFAAYVGFGSSSNLLTKAAFFRKGIIVTAGTCIGERVERFRTGVAIRENSAADCAAAIERLAASAPREEDFDSYFQSNSIEELEKKLKMILNKNEER